jgi:hypothetical protein
VGILWAVAVDNITRQPETIAPVTMIACGFWTGGRERVPFFFFPLVLYNCAFSNSKVVHTRYHPNPKVSMSTVTFMAVEVLYVRFLGCNSGALIDD